MLGGTAIEQAPGNSRRRLERAPAGRERHRVYDVKNLFKKKPENSDQVLTRFLKMR